MADQQNFTTNKNLSTPLSSTRNSIITDILNLYQCKPSPERYQHFHDTCSFADPLADARDLTQVKAQFNAMPKVFTKSITKSCEVISNTDNEIRMDLIQEYTVVGINKDIEMQSLVVIGLNKEEKVIKLEDQWDHKASWKENGIMAFAVNQLRRVNALVLPVVVDT